jgi:predicted RNA-binding Zn-ribbon protein involved in translation (DUF1610 family)
MTLDIIYLSMASGTSTLGASRCRNCGFEAPGGDDAWVRLDVPKLGRMTQCPECGSTDVMTRQ